MLFDNRQFRSIHRIEMVPAKIDIREVMECAHVFFAVPKSVRPRNRFSEGFRVFLPSSLQAVKMKTQYFVRTGGSGRRKL